MARPADPKRREDLLAAAIIHLSKSGLGNVSVRSLAAALGVTAPTLLYHFGSKEGLIAEVLQALERTELAAAGEDGGDLVSKLRQYWSDRTGTSDLERFRLQVEAVCLSAAEALPAPVMASIYSRWVDAIRRELEASGFERGPSESFATLLHATQVGLLTDLLATEDRDRVDRAQAVFFEVLQRLLGVAKGVEAADPDRADTNAGVQS